MLMPPPASTVVVPVMSAFTLLMTTETAKNPPEL